MNNAGSIKPYDEDFDDDDDPHQSTMSKPNRRRVVAQRGGDISAGDVFFSHSDFDSVVYGLGKVQLIKNYRQTYS